MISYRLEAETSLFILPRQVGLAQFESVIRLKLLLAVCSTSVDGLVAFCENVSLIDLVL